MSPSQNKQSKKEVLQAKHQIFMQIRNFFDKRAFTEIHTPLLVPNPGLEPDLIPFETEFVPSMGGGKNIQFYLPTSPEYHLKRALALGFDKVFEITKSFRNGEKSFEHEPEFFMLEWYRHPGGYRDIAQDCRELFQELGARWAPSAPWSQSEDLTVCEAFQKYAQLDLRAALEGTAPSLTQQACNLKHPSIQADDDFESTFFKVMVQDIEPRLGERGPLFLWDYPSQFSALARQRPGDPLFCERFEIYWQGIELGNAFGELTDATLQRERCEADRRKRMERYGTTPPLDEAFLRDLEKLDQGAGGIAVGVERLVQCLLGLKSIQETIAFSHWDSL